MSIPKNANYWRDLGRNEMVECSEEEPPRRVGAAGSEPAGSGSVLRQVVAQLNRAPAIGRVGSWHLNVSDRILAWSAETHRIFGIAEGTPLTYETFLAAVHPDDRQAVDDAWQAALRGVPYDLVHRVVADGAAKWVHERAELEFDATGRVLGGIGTVQDITEQKRTEEALRAKTEELQTAQHELASLNGELERRVRERTAQVERLLRHQRDLITHLSHDLKTPLTPLLSLLPLMLETEQDPTRRRMLALALEAAQGIHAGVMRVLELCQLDEPGFPVSLHGENLHDLVEGAMAACGSASSIGQRTLTNDVPPTLEVRADPRLVRQALGHLLDNALKFTSSGGSIIVRAVANHAAVSVEVRDDGIGLDAQHCERVFEPFYKTDPSRHDRSSPGLGLTIARAIIERQGGRIWAESAGLHRGMAICFTLPAGMAEE